MLFYPSGGLQLLHPWGRWSLFCGCKDFLSLLIFFSYIHRMYDELVYPYTIKTSKAQKSESRYLQVRLRYTLAQKVPSNRIHQAPKFSICIGFWFIVPFFRYTILCNLNVICRAIQHTPNFSREKICMLKSNNGITYLKVIFKKDFVIV